MTNPGWPSFRFLRRLMLFYLSVWLGTGVLTVVAICFWFKPLITFVALQEAVGFYIIFRMYRRLWMRWGRPPMGVFAARFLRAQGRFLVALGAYVGRFLNSLHARLGEGSSIPLHMPTEH